MFLLSEYLPTIILASKSTGRKQLLEEQGCTVIVDAIDCDENNNFSSIEQRVLELALLKLNTYLAIKKEIVLPVISGDTLIALNNRVIGKATSIDEAKGQLLAFSGQKHTVYSAFALYLPKDKRIYKGVDKTAVTFKNLDEKTIANYLKSNSWQQAAGSYRLQNDMKRFIAKIEGETSTVVGLPLPLISAIFTKPSSF
jgi:septum formation protein